MLDGVVIMPDVGAQDETVFVEMAPHLAQRAFTPPWPLTWVQRGDRGRRRASTRDRAFNTSASRTDQRSISSPFCSVTRESTARR
jgi:hypothetical protein